VQNLATGAYLEGAVVTAQPGRHTTLTSRDGRFYFSSLPPGEYRVTVTYTGLDSHSELVPLVAGQSAAREFALTSGIYALEAFTVAGEREGNALAITQQRNAPNVKNVISADAFGNIADQNLGDLLMRLPGIAEEVLEGEVRSVAVRGIAADMNAVTLDGTRGASGGTGTMNRAFAIDRIPADFVERIEVTKALTPDMDGDSIGGAINLRTKSPLDRKGRSITYMGGTSWNLDRNTFRPTGSFSYSNVFGAEEKLGLLVTSSYNRTHKPRDSVYKNWQTTTDTSVPAYFWMSNLGEDKLTHERTGVGLRADYKLSSTHRVFVNTMYSDYEDTLDRRHFVMTPTAAQIVPGWTDAVTETRNHNLTLSQNHRIRTVESVNLVIGGEKRFQSSFLDYGANLSHSRGTEDRVIPRWCTAPSSSAGMNARWPVAVARPAAVSIT
jgi:TonB-dependent receptor